MNRYVCQRASMQFIVPRKAANQGEHGINHGRATHRRLVKAGRQTMPIAVNYCELALRDETLDRTGGIIRLIPGSRPDSYATPPPPGHEGACTLQTNPGRRSPFWGIAACFILAFICLSGGIYQTRLLLHLTKEGKRADAVVTGIDVGARGSKRAVLQFVTDTGSIAVSRDQFQMMLFRFHKGDHVTALYDPADPGMVTVDLGLWTWQHAVFFYFGFLFLGILGLFLARPEPAQKPG